jgi:hypothetical protein
MTKPVKRKLRVCLMGICQARVAAAETPMRSNWDF